MDTRVLLDPPLLLLEGAGHQVERDGRLRDLPVVDAAKRLCVTRPRQSSGGLAGTRGAERGDSASVGVVVRA